MSALAPPWPADGVADVFTATSRALLGAVEPISAAAARLERAAASALPAGWQGPAATSAGHLLRRRAHGIAAVARALDIAQQSLARAATVVADASDRAVRALRAAVVGATTLPGCGLPWVMGAELELAESVVQVQRASTNCAAMLRSAADRCRAVLRGTDETPSARADMVRQLGPATAAAWLAAVPAPGTAADRVALWWAAHTPAEQLRLIAGRATAAAVGALGGVPAGARDRANRAVLARRLAAWAAHPAPGADGAPAAAAAHAVDLRLLDELDRVRVDPLTGTRVPVLLLDYEPQAWAGRGRAAIAFGRLDTAAHVAYVVPGLAARVDPGLPGLAGSAWQLYAATRRLASRPAVATVAWLGYETPDLPEVAFLPRAQAGAAALARELAGLRAARNDDQPHVTVVGHSYGSVVAALATRLLPGGVDELAVLGSPGVTVERATDLPVPSGHVFVGAASADPVSHLSRFGVDPAAASFGAHRFPAETATGTSLLGQHSHYLDGGTASLASLARIVAGNGGSTPVVPGRTDGGFAGAGAELLLPPLLIGLLHLAPEPTFGDPAVGQ